MRLAVFVFSFVLIISTSVAHAFAFLPAVSGVAGAIMRSSVGHYFKIGSKKVLAGAMMAGGYELANRTIGIAKDFCKKNPQKCKDLIGEASEYFWEDDELYQCVFKYKGSHVPKDYTDSQSAYNAVLSHMNKSPTLYSYQVYDYAAQDNKDAFNDFEKKYKKSGTKGKWLYGVSLTVPVFATQNGKTSAAAPNAMALYAKIKCNDGDDIDDIKDEIDNSKQQRAQQQIQQIIKNMSDDDVNIIINNYGDQIDIDKYCSQSKSCLELDKDFANEVKKNKNNYDIDKITKENCEIENGKVTSCDKAKKQLELDLESDDEDTKKEEENDKKDDDKKGGIIIDEDNDTEINANKEDDDEPIDCDSSGLTKKICDFVGWSKSADYDDENDKLDIKKHDEKEPNSKVNFTGRCPAKYELEINLEFGFMGNINYNLVLLDTPQLCEFLDDWVQPIVYFLGPLHALYILGGKRDEV